jgi:hypothetical protein
MSSMAVTPRPFERLVSVVSEIMLRVSWNGEILYLDDPFDPQVFRSQLRYPRPLVCSPCYTDCVNVNTRLTTFSQGQVVEVACAMTCH